jgi:hypothetical protein
MIRLSPMSFRRDGHAEKMPALAEVQAVYSDLAARPIHRQCTLRAECCQFQLTGLVPFVTKGEALLAANALRATGRKRLPTGPTGTCPFLDSKTSRCLIYNARPFACRTHFCEAAGGPYLRREVLDLIRRLERVDEKLGGDGPRALRSAIVEALQTLA